ncbi:MAG TPA: DoxX family protein [Dongiaceae bacterium]
MSQAAIETSLSAYAPKVLSIVRIAAGLIFLEHGTQKLFGFPATDHMPDTFTLAWFAGILEAFGGLLVALGLFTRQAAFIVSGEMAAAYFMVHFPKSFFPALNGGDAAILFCFLFLYLVFAGPGPLSLDALRRGQRG